MLHHSIASTWLQTRHWWFLSWLRQGSCWHCSFIQNLHNPPKIMNSGSDTQRKLMKKHEATNFPFDWFRAYQYQVDSYFAFDGVVILILYPVSRSSQGHYKVEWSALIKLDTQSQPSTRGRVHLALNLKTRNGSNSNQCWVVQFCGFLLAVAVPQ